MKTTQQEVTTILQKTELDWSVRKENLVAISTREQSLGKILETPNSGIYRDDSDGYLGTTSKKYVLYQNRELVTTMYEAAKSIDLNIDSGGEVYGGEKVFLNMNLRDEYVGDSMIKRSVTAMSSHTGKASIGFGSSNKILTRDSKGNHNEFKFYRSFGSYDSFRHCAAASGRVKNAVEALFATLVEDKQLMDSFKLMANTKCNDDLLYMIIQNCFKIDMNVNQKTLTVRQLNKMNKVAGIISQQVKNEKDSVWGLFTGILKCSQDLKPQTKDAQDYVMAGTGYNVNMKAYNTITKYLEANL